MSDRRRSSVTSATPTRDGKTPSEAGSNDALVVGTVSPARGPVSISTAPTTEKSEEFELQVQNAAQKLMKAMGPTVIAREQKEAHAREDLDFWKECVLNAIKAGEGVRSSTAMADLLVVEMRDRRKVFDS